MGVVLNVLSLTLVVFFFVGVVKVQHQSMRLVFSGCLLLAMSWWLYVSLVSLGLA